MISLLIAQVMMTTLDTSPQAAVPATDFRCTFIRPASAETVGGQFDLFGSIPAIPEGHDPNASFPMQLGSTDGSPLAGRASANSGEISEWFREYQIYRHLGEQSYTLNLKLRREGTSVAYATLYDGRWQDAATDHYEPFRYDAVGLCTTDFEPDTGAGQ